MSIFIDYFTDLSSLHYIINMLSIYLQVSLVLLQITKPHNVGCVRVIVHCQRQAQIALVLFGRCYQDRVGTPLRLLVFFSILVLNQLMMHFVCLVQQLIVVIFNLYDVLVNIIHVLVHQLIIRFIVVHLVVVSTICLQENVIVRVVLSVRSPLLV